MHATNINPFKQNTHHWEYSTTHTFLGVLPVPLFPIETPSMARMTSFSSESHERQTADILRL